jgi:hypothetical protein
MQPPPNTRSTVRPVATGFDQAYSVKKGRRRSTTAPPSEAKRSVFLRVEMQPDLKWIYFCASGRRLRGNGVLALCLGGTGQEQSQRMFWLSWPEHCAIPI